MGPNNGQRSDKRRNYNKELAFVGKNNGGKNNNRNDRQKIDRLNFIQSIIVKRAIKNKVVGNGYSYKN